MDFLAFHLFVFMLYVPLSIFFGHVGTFPGLNQYCSESKLSNFFTSIFFFNLQLSSFKAMAYKELNKLAISTIGIAHNLISKNDFTHDDLHFYQDKGHRLTVQDQIQEQSDLDMIVNTFDEHLWIKDFF